MGRHPDCRVVNMRIILDRGLGWGNNSTGQVRGVWKFGEGVDGNSLIDHSGETEHLNKISWVGWEWRWEVVGTN